jgi:hypothetical protein
VAAITDLAHYRELLAAPREVVPFQKLATLTSGVFSSYYQQPNKSVAAPTTAEAPTNAAGGSLQQVDGGTETLYFTGGMVTARQAGTYWLIDRLSHQGGLSGIVTTAQTTNLPTAALTRYTTGEGVMLAIEINTAIGGTATTVTVSYTNQAGTAGRTSPAVVIGGSGNNGQARFILVPLQSGDTGVRSVQSTTGTAGAFGVVLFKPLLAFVVEGAGRQVELNLIDGGMLGGMPEVLDGACLTWCANVNGSSTTMLGHLFTAAV